jgi:hypothetical protein
VDLTVEVVNWAANSSHIAKIIHFRGRDTDCFSRVPEGSKVAQRSCGYGCFCSHATLRGATRNIAYVEEDCVHVRVIETKVHSR